MLFSVEFTSHEVDPNNISLSYVYFFFKFIYSMIEFPLRIVQMKTHLFIDFDFWTCTFVSEAGHFRTLVVKSSVLLLKVI